MSKKMYITLIVLSAFVLIFITMLYFFPGKLEKNIPEEAGEEQIFQAENLAITRFPAIGPRQVSYPGSKLKITNKRIIISQKGMGSSNLIVREIMLNEKEPGQALSGQQNWGNVLISTVNYQSAFSLNGKTVLLKNPKAANLDRFEINGINKPERLMEAIQNH